MGHLGKDRPHRSKGHCQPTWTKDKPFQTLSQGSSKPLQKKIKSHDLTRWYCISMNVFNDTLSDSIKGKVKPSKKKSGDVNSFFTMNTIKST